MELEIVGLSGVLILDMFFIWLLVSLFIIFGLAIFGTLYLDSGFLRLNDKRIIKKIIQLKNTDKELYNFASKLDKDNIKFLIKYKVDKFEKVVILNNFNQKLERFLSNDNDKRLYKKIESIIYYYNLINEN